MNFNVEKSKIGDTKRKKDKRKNRYLLRIENEKS